MYQVSCAHRSDCGLPRALLVVLMLILLLLSQPVSGVTAKPCLATDETSGHTATIRALLLEVSHHLEWPETITLRPDIRGRALGISTLESPGHASSVAISVVDRLDGATHLDDLAESGKLRGLYEGWEAVIVRSGDTCGAKEAVACTGGLIAWRCGRYVFVAEDESGSGREIEAARVLHRAASDGKLCGLCSTIVILAETSLTPGQMPLDHFRDLALKAGQYYAENGYGRVDLPFRFLDSDGPLGTHDWHNVGPHLSHYAHSAESFAIAALRTALSRIDLPKAAYVERAIVVCPMGTLPGTPRLLFAQTIWQRSEDAVDVVCPRGVASVYVRNIVLVSEEDRVGTWVHEIGHTLRSKYEGRGFQRITDRYQSDNLDKRYGHVGRWDLMGTGSRCGDPEGTSPTHMSSYTKEAAGWLHYMEAEYGRSYTLLPLERQHAGGQVLRLDDPLSADPLYYYIIEARDRETTFGAPVSGVMIYRVAYDYRAHHAIVDAMTSESLSPRIGDDDTIIAPSLHGLGSPNCVARYGDRTSGFAVTLLAESHRPYQATVRIERCS